MNLTLTCSRGRWIYGDYVGQPYESFCKAVCTIPCLNGGSCVEANTCKCLPGFNGDYCERKIPSSCDVLTPPIPNSAISLE